MRTVLENILQMHHTAQNPVIQKPVQTVEKERQSVQEKDAWERVTISRKNDRPVGQDYIRILFSDFLEFHGDRCYGDDTAIIGGIARFAGIPVTVIAQAKGKSTKENVAHHFGMPSPEGYRKALRLMKQAEKFKRPILLFVDTPGAFCGIEAEERGQGEAIARNLFEMSSMKVPILSVVIGEGGSGGALALAVADEVWMLENAIYSVLSPEGFASILWKDSKRASEAAAVMKLTAADLKKLGVIEAVIAEPEVYTEETMQSVVFVLMAFAVVGFEPKRFHGFEQGGDLLFFCVRFENDNHLCPDPFDLAILCVKVYAVSGRLSRRLNEKYLCRQQGKGEKLAEQSHLSVVINIGATTFASINWAISVIDGYGAVRILLCIL